MYTPLYKIFKVVPLSFQEVMILLTGGFFVWGASYLYYTIFRPRNNRLITGS
jgi:hypothetical protein